MINMKPSKILLILFSLITLFSCNNDDDLSTNDQINSFIYRGLNAVYLYKDEQPLLDRSFSSINNGSPEDFFETLTVSEDRFSFIVDDFVALENSFAGISLSDGIDFRLSRISEDSNDLIGYVFYVDKNSAGEIAGVQRGDFFYTVNDETLTLDNYSEFLSNSNSYTVELLTYNPEGEDSDFSLENFEFRTEVTVNKFEYNEDPILVNKVIDFEGVRVGYIMYTRFLAGSENDLNTVFEDFDAQGIDELVLDLRYNGGGRVSTAIDLCGMITGQFNDEILIAEQWNSDLQARFEDEDPERLVSRFRNKLTDEETDVNSLNLTRIHIISSKGRTASASELVINGLDAYIDVVHVGDAEGTVGKSQASTTLYDSPSLTSNEDASSRHRYAIQPLIYRSANKDGFSVPNEGLTPDVFFTEDIFNLGILGDADEPFLNTALNAIIGNSLAAKNTTTPKKVLGSTVANSKERNLNYQRMYD